MVRLLCVVCAAATVVVCGGCLAGGAAVAVVYDRHRSRANGPVQAPTTGPTEPHVAQAVRDGGDRGERATPALRGGFEGVEPGDTVVRYRAAFERRDRTARSNEVRVDSPRFVQVTAWSGPQEFSSGSRSTRAELALRGQGLNGLASARAVLHRRTAYRTAGELCPSLADGRAVPSEASAGAAAAIDAMDTTFGLNVAQTGTRLLLAKRISRTITNEAVAKGLIQTGYPVAIQEAVVSVEDRAPDVVGQITAPVARPPRKARLVLIKSVDRQQAAPGDILTFTIQYHNIGDDPIGRAVIVDSLSRRLQYIPDSATSSRKARIDMRVNALGKPEIYWHIDGLIDADEFGTVRFKAKVTTF